MSTVSRHNRCLADCRQQTPQHRRDATIQPLLYIAAAHCILLPIPRYIFRSKVWIANMFHTAATSRFLSGPIRRRMQAQLARASASGTETTSPLATDVILPSLRANALEIQLVLCPSNSINTPSFHHFIIIHITYHIAIDYRSPSEKDSIVSSGHRYLKPITPHTCTRSVTPAATRATCWRAI